MTMMNKEYADKAAPLIEQAEELGLNKHSFFDPKNLPLREDVRAMCAQNFCRNYEKNWTCPPANGTLEEWRERFAHYKAGIVLQHVVELEDSFDFESMMEGEAIIQQAFIDLKKTYQEAGDEYLFLSVGGCKICETCTYPDAPCVFPELAIPSVESIGILVNELCNLAEIPYYYGEGTLAYTGAVLMK